MAKWFLVKAERWKYTAVTSGYKAALLAEMKLREKELGRPDGPLDLKVEEVHSWHLDAGGWMIESRPVEEFKISGMIFSVPCEHVHIFASQLRKLEPRYFGKGSRGSEYYKLHSKWNCIVLTPTIKERLQAELEAREDDADKRATEFFESIVLTPTIKERLQAELEAREDDTSVLRSFSRSGRLRILSFTR
jgi:hypothetical protein